MLNINEYKNLKTWLKSNEENFVEKTSRRSVIIRVISYFFPVVILLIIAILMGKNALFGYLLYQKNNILATFMAMLIMLIDVVRIQNYFELYEQTSLDLKNNKLLSIFLLVFSILATFILGIYALSGKYSDDQIRELVNIRREETKAQVEKNWEKTDSTKLLEEEIKSKKEEYEKMNNEYLAQVREYPGIRADKLSNDKDELENSIKKKENELEEYKKSRQKEINDKVSIEIAEYEKELKNFNYSSLIVTNTKVLQLPGKFGLFISLFIDLVLTTIMEFIIKIKSIHIKKLFI